MKITITLSDTDARSMQWLLQKHYQTKAKLPRLVKHVLMEKVSEAAKKYLNSESGITSLESK